MCLVCTLLVIIFSFQWPLQQCHRFSGTALGLSTMQLCQCQVPNKQVIPSAVYERVHIETNSGTFKRTPKRILEIRCTMKL